jgi:hypothetical protein
MKPPIQHLYDLSRMSAAGDEIVVAAKDDELARLAQWAEVAGVTRFEGRISLSKMSQTRFVYEAELEADIEQSCVVTLEPVRSHIARSFSRTLHLTGIRAAARDLTVTVSPGDDDSPEEIESPRYDLAGPLLEEFVLAIDPYPRAAGVAFEAPAPEAAPESPFAVLKGLKPGG